MNPRQLIMVEHNEPAILDFLYQHAATLLPFMERKKVIDSETRSTLVTSRVSDHDMVDQTLKKIKVAKNGWEGLIGFLNQYGGSHLTVKLLDGLENTTLPATEGNCLAPQRTHVATQRQPDILQSPARYLIADGLNNPKGLVMIINNNQFSSGLSTRKGSQHDRDKSVKLWSKLGYSVVWHTDLSAEDMNTKMYHFATNPLHADFHSAVVVVMSHGVLGKIYGKDDGQVVIEQFVKKLSGNNCPALKGKPKMFLIQACREREYATGCFGVQEDSEKSEEIINEEQIRKSLSWLKDDGQVQTDGITYEDVIVGYSTSKETVSYRNEHTGAYYIQAICSIFEAQYKEKHVQDLLDAVGKDVAAQKISQIATYEHNLKLEYYI